MWWLEGWQAGRQLSTGWLQPGLHRFWKWLETRFICGKWNDGLHGTQLVGSISLRLCKVYYPRSQGVIWPSFSSYANWPISMQIWFLFYRYQFRRGRTRARDLRQMKIKRPALMHFDTVKIGTYTNQRELQRSPPSLLFLLFFLCFSPFPFSSILLRWSL